MEKNAEDDCDSNHSQRHCVILRFTGRISFAPLVRDEDVSEERLPLLLSPSNILAQG